jgi:multiple sugar transport system substrate-binding protein
MVNIQVESEWRRRLFDVYTFYIAASSGGTLLENGQVDFDNRTMVDVLRFIRTGFEEGWYPKSIFAGDMFIQERIAAVVTGPWNIAHTENLKPEGFRYTFGPIPVPHDHEGKQWTFGDPKSIGIFSTTKHPEAAWAFVKFAISKRADLRLLEIANQLPLRRDLLRDSLYADYFEANPLMRVFAERMPYTKGFDQHPALQEVFDALNTAYDACCVNQAVPADEAVELAAQRSRHILKMRKH